MSCEILQIKKTANQLLISFKIKDVTSLGETPLLESSHLATGLYVIFCIVNQCDFKLKMNADGIEHVRAKFIEVYNQHRSQNLGRVFYHNTAFVFDFKADSGQSEVRVMEWVEKGALKM